jgi:hypothetical protein
MKRYATIAATVLLLGFSATAQTSTSSQAGDYAQVQAPAGSAGVSQGTQINSHTAGKSASASASSGTTASANIGRNSAGVGGDAAAQTSASAKPLNKAAGAANATAGAAENTSASAGANAKSTAQSTASTSVRTGANAARQGSSSTSSVLDQQMDVHSRLNNTTQTSLEPKSGSAGLTNSTAAGLGAHSRKR